MTQLTLFLCNDADAAGTTQDGDNNTLEGDVVREGSGLMSPDPSLSPSPLTTTSSSIIAATGGEDAATTTQSMPSIHNSNSCSSRLATEQLSPGDTAAAAGYRPQQLPPDHLNNRDLVAAG